MHAAALAALNVVQDRVQKQPASAVVIFVAMTGKTGAIDLDRITKAKTLENIMLSTDDETLRKIVRHLQTIILRPDTQDQATADSRRQVIADMLLGVVRNYKGYERSEFTMDGEHDNWLRKVLEILVENAYFVPSASAKTSKVPLPPLSDSSRKIFQERLSSCLTRLLRVQTEAKTSFASLAVEMIRSKASNSKSLELLFKADESILKTVDKAFKTIDKITAKVRIVVSPFVLLANLCSIRPKARTLQLKDSFFSIPLHFFRCTMEMETPCCCWMTLTRHVKLCSRARKSLLQKGRTLLLKFSLLS